MSTALTDIKTLPPVELGVADDVIAGLRKRLTGLKADTPVGYELVKAGLSEVVTLRNGVDKSRRALKRAVDNESKRVLGLLGEIEEPLRREKQKVDEERQRVQREQEEQARLEREAKEREEREKREAAERAEREKREAEERAERERLAAEQRQERERLAAEREKLRKEQEALAAERAKIEEERRRREEEEASKRRAEEQKQRAKDEAERKRKEEEERAKAKAEAKRLEEERRPDREKLIAFAGGVHRYANQTKGHIVDFPDPPMMSTSWGRDEMESFMKMLAKWASEIILPTPEQDTQE